MHSLPQDASSKVEASVLASKLGLSLPTTDDRQASNMFNVLGHQCFQQQHIADYGSGSSMLGRFWILLHLAKPGVSQQLSIGCAAPIVEL